MIVANSIIPLKVSDDKVLDAFDLMRVEIEKDIVDEHLIHNQQVWSEGHDDSMGVEENLLFIENQNTNTMSKLKYGVAIEKITETLFGQDMISASNNACGVIAAYNALVSLNNGTSPVDFPTLLSEFEMNGTCVYGNFGTAPSKMEEYFNDNGYVAKLFSGQDITSEQIKNIEEKYATYMVTSYNNRSEFLSGIHNFSITNDIQGNFVRHNAGDNTKYATLEDAIASYGNGESELISIIGVKNKETISKEMIELLEIHSLGRI